MANRFLQSQPTQGKDDVAQPVVDYSDGLDLTNQQPLAWSLLQIEVRPQNFVDNELKSNKDEGYSLPLDLEEPVHDGFEHKQVSQT